eukprot:NODE_4160_length_1217_cov_36.201097_g3663_i0.p1 GENE.NODE_4160_length_1217_cov_36.201097_g3663_i0~~NODE_4160_length_1217_cov_36.201097_g3663_i0.p1  ORF type:complete len:350 (-),score=64.74 NODE_4160_length_1217_cov_36.201097_g3663_i0:166-1179(-)
MYNAAYDWRMANHKTEERDGYLSNMKHRIELLYKRTGHKVVIIGHSFGANVIYFFLKWVESDQGGQGGPNWVNEHIHAYIDLAGPHLGVSKSLSALYSGEMKDTAMLGPLDGLLKSLGFGSDRRAPLFRTWHSLSAMLPKGGDRIWWGPMITTENKSLSLEQSIRLLRPFVQNLYEWFDLGSKPPQNQTFRQWSNPLASTLPKAPDMKIFCFYGVKLPTERAYRYNNGEIARSISDREMNISNGVEFETGDGTVPLISLGYMCSHAWKTKKYNPSEIPVVTRQYISNPIMFYPRGRESADHVDIMGNLHLTMDVLRVVTGYDVNITDQVHVQVPEKD